MTENLKKDKRNDMKQPKRMQIVPNIKKKAEWNNEIMEMRKPVVNQVWKQYNF